MSEKLTKPLANYPHYREVGGLIFLAGQGCRDPETGKCVGITHDLAHHKVSSHCIATQTKGVFDNIRRVLHTKGLDLNDLVDVTIFLKDFADFAIMNEIWNKTIDPVYAPTRTTVVVADLPDDNFIEMKAIAAMRKS